jgi:hypothetical protein
MANIRLTFSMEMRGLVPMPETRARLDVERIGACGDMTLLGNTAYIKNHAGL